MVWLHTAYKRGNFTGVEQSTSGEKLDMVREILELKDETKDAGEFMKSVKSDIFFQTEFMFLRLKVKYMNYLKVRLR